MCHRRARRFEIQKRRVHCGKLLHGRALPSDGREDTWPATLPKRNALASAPARAKNRRTQKKRADRSARLNSISSSQISEGRFRPG